MPLKHTDLGVRPGISKGGVEMPANFLQGLAAFVLAVGVAAICIAVKSFCRRVVRRTQSKKATG